jgi:3-deoxy-7-phosphoheptulonate synthase
MPPSVPLLEELTHLPVVVDPSHATGKRSLVPSMAKASIACGADGLMVEIHPNPEKALSDGPQSLRLPEFEQLMKDLQPYIQLWKAERSAAREAALVGKA